jgi:hypothetical protein
MTTLSPQAQAVYDAVREICPAPADEIAAAALRAASDQVVPDAADHLRTAINSPDWWDAHDQIRAELLAIAAEMEAGNG